MKHSIALPGIEPDGGLEQSSAAPQCLGWQARFTWLLAHLQIPHYVHQMCLLYHLLSLLHIHSHPHPSSSNISSNILHCQNRCRIWIAILHFCINSLPKLSFNIYNNTVQGITLHSTTTFVLDHQCIIISSTFLYILQMNVCEALTQSNPLHWNSWTFWVLFPCLGLFCFFPAATTEELWWIWMKDRIKHWSPSFAQIKIPAHEAGSGIEQDEWHSNSALYTGPISQSK